MKKRRTSLSKDKLHTLRNKLHIEGHLLLLTCAFIVIAVFFGITTPRFFKPESIVSMAFQCPEIGLMALGMMSTMIIGGINLSINDTANLSALLSGIFLAKIVPSNIPANQMTMYIGGAMIIALLVGFLCGVLNGFLVGHIEVSPILATLATLILFRGISVAITGGKTLTGFPEQLSVIGHNTVLGIPIPFLILLVIAGLLYIILNRTTLGFKARMMGTNPNASRFSGINNKAITMKIYIISGVLGAIAGIIVMSRTNSAAYEYGTRTYILLTLLIAVLGGVSPGFGNVAGVVLAVFILQMLSTGFHMLLMGVRGSAFFKDFSWGVLLILFLIIGYFMRGRKGSEQS